MIIKPVLLPVLLFLVNSCTRQKDAEKPPEELLASTTYRQYNILKDQHYCDQSVYIPVEYSELNFLVKFDSTAVYKTTDPANQYDINKLYGFSDNDAQHHQFSARIGWRWSNGALRLFGYVYNNGVVSYNELGIISIGAEHSCSIKITPDAYIFSVNENMAMMPRLSTTVKARGYKLFPYFGGDETAPHDVSIWIKEN